MTCPNCGVTDLPPDKYCPNCGYTLPPPSTWPPTPSGQPPRMQPRPGSQWGWLVAICAFFVGWGLSIGAVTAIVTLFPKYKHAVGASYAAALLVVLLPWVILKVCNKGPYFRLGLLIAFATIAVVATGLAVCIGMLAGL